MTQARIHVIPFAQLARILRGEAVVSLPGDAAVVGADIIGGGNLGIRIHSVKYPRLPEGELPPVSAATIRTKPEA